MSNHTITDLLLRLGDGDRAALDQLLPILHGDLQRVARRQPLTEHAMPEALGITTRTVECNWRRAKAWLSFDLGAGGEAHVP